MLQRHKLRTRYTISRHYTAAAAAAAAASAPAAVPFLVHKYARKNRSRNSTSSTSSIEQWHVLSASFQVKQQLADLFLSYCRHSQNVCGPTDSHHQLGRQRRFATTNARRTKGLQHTAIICTSAARVSWMSMGRNKTALPT